MIDGIQDVFLFVEDMKRSVAFYRDVLGLTVLHETSHWTSLDVGGQRLGLHWTEGPPVPAVPHDNHGPRAGAVLTFRTGDIDAAVATLRERGVELLGDVSRNPWGALAAFRDPDGNVLKLMQPPE